jgi:CHAD domain-containing protein
MLNGLDSDRYFRLLVRLEDFAFGRGGTRARPAPQLVVTAARAAIKDTFRRVLKRGRRMGPAPTDEQLHALRIRAKRLRYLLEFLRDVTGKPGRRVVRQLVRLQDLLGSHHDAVVATASVQRYVAAASAAVAAPALLALGMLIGEQQRVADATRGEFRKAWRRFTRERTLSDLDAVLAGLRVRGRRQPARPVVRGAPPAAQL